jgi:glycosyltransferase involved in cell wall biosynthesis
VRILQVVHDFVPETMAGTEINTHKLALDLHARYGHEVHVFCRGWDLACEPYRERDEWVGPLRVRRVDFGAGGPRNRWRRHDESLEAALRHMIEAVRPQLVHVQHFIYLSTAVVAIAKEYGVPVVSSLRNFWFRCPLGTLLYHDDSPCQRSPGTGCLSCLWPDQAGRRRKLIPWRQLNPLLIEAYERFGEHAPLPPQAADILSSLTTWGEEFRAALLSADRLHSPSRFLKGQLIGFGVPAERVAVVVNGADYDPARVRAKRRGARLRVGMMGMHRIKGLHVLIEAFRGLPGDAAELRIYGQVPDQQYVAAQRRRAEGCNVTFSGTFDREQLYEVFAELDVLVVPSIWYENCPTVIGEAFATGTPVIASDIGGMAEAVRDGVNGLLFRAGDAASLRERLERLIAAPDLVATLAANIVPPLTVQQCTDGIVDVYEQVVGRSARRAQ